jgi:hypothetical protein
LTWTDNATNETGYLVERSTNGVDFTTVTTLGANATSYSNTGLTASTQYTYRVTAVGVSLNSAPSNTSSATTLAAPVGTTIRVNAGGTSYVDSLGQTWVSDSGFANNGGSAYSVSTNLLPIDGTTDDKLFSERRWGNNFKYSAPATNGNYTLKLYFFESVMTGPNQRLFNVTAEGSQILTNFDIYTEAGGNLKALVKTFNVTITDGKLDLGFVSSIDNALLSGIELIPAAVTIPTAPNAPTNLTASAVSSSQINLTWTDNASNETGYLVERSTNGTTFSTVTTLGANATSYSNTGLAASTQYTYQVTAVGSSANSAPSATATTTTLQAGTTLRVNAAGGTYVDSQGKTWAADSGFTASTADTRPLDVVNPPDDPLYDSRRYAADFGYSAAVANGTSTLNLYFIETYYTVPNARRFSVTAEGVQVITDLDIYAEAGTKNPLIKSFTVNVTDGKLDLHFFSSVENAIISAIELVPKIN